MIRVLKSVWRLTRSCLGIPVLDETKENRSDELLESAHRLARGGEYERLHEVCEMILADAESRAEEYENEREIGRFFGNVEEFSTYSHAFSLYACSPKDIIWLSNAHAEAWFLRGFAFVEQENFQRAIECLQEASRLWPSNPSYLCELAYCYEKLGRNEEAMAVFRGSTDLCRNTPHPELMEIIDGAIQGVRRLIAEGDAEPDSDVLQTAEELRAALLNCYRSIQARAWRGVGFQCIELERWGEAEAAFHRSLELEPGNGNALSELEYIDDMRPSVPGEELGA